MILQKFVFIEANHSIFVFLAQRLILKVYINNLLIIGSIQKEIDKIKRILTRKFKMNDLDLVNWYLDFKISYDILASKMIAPYIEKILKYFEM